jgi:hypothetical protein
VLLLRRAALWEIGISSASRAHHPREAIPVQGSWYGSASDHLAMKVAVKVKAVADTGA